MRLDAISPRHDTDLAREKGRRFSRGGMITTFFATGGTHLDLEEVLGGPVDLVEGLVSRVWHGLHYRASHAGHAARRAGHRAGVGGCGRVLGRRLGRDAASRFLLGGRRFDGCFGVATPTLALYSCSALVMPQQARQLVD